MSVDGCLAGTCETAEVNSQGWFPDPQQPGRLRYFDGTVWTEQYAEETPPPAVEGSSPTPPKPEPKSTPAWLVFLIVIPVVIVGAVIYNWSESRDSDPPPTVPLTAREAARFIWDEEADEYEFCKLYWNSIPNLSVLWKLSFKETFLRVSSSSQATSRSRTRELIMITKALEACPFSHCESSGLRKMDIIIR